MTSGAPGSAPYTTSSSACRICPALAATCSGVVPFSCGHSRRQPRGDNTATPPGLSVPPRAHRVEEVGLSPQREQAQARLQVARPHAGVQLLRGERQQSVPGVPPAPRGGPVTPRPHLAEVLGGDPVVIPARQLVHEGQHLVLGADELRLGGAGRHRVSGGGIQHSPPPPPSQPPPHSPHLLHFVLGVRLPAPALHLRRVQQRMLPDGVGPIAGQGVHHLCVGGTVSSGTPPQTPTSPPTPPGCTHLQQRGGPGAVPQVLDDGDVAAQAAVHAAALVADEHTAVDGGPARVCGGRGVLWGGGPSIHHPKWGWELGGGGAAASP